MNKNRRHREDTGSGSDPLTRLLRQADPAAGDPGLDAVERARLRQGITTAADERALAGVWGGGRQGWMKPAFAAVAALIIVALGLWFLGGNPTGRVGGEIADVEIAAPEPGPMTPEPAPTTSPAAVLETNPAPENTTVAALDTLSPPDKHARTVQFTATRGTRIIWTLDPNFESPIAGSESRQEQGQ